MSISGNRKNGFLSVAYHLKFIDVDQAWKIIEWKEGHDRKNPQSPMPCGEVGITLGILTQERVDRILAFQKDTQNKFEKYLDVLGARPIATGAGHFDVGRKVVLVLFALALVGVGAYYRSVKALIDVVHSWVFVQGLVEVLHPLLTKSRFEWRTLLFRLAPLGAIFFLANTLYFASAMKSAGADAAQAEVMWQWMILSFLFAGLCVFIVLCHYEWRRRRLEYVEVRGIMMADLVRLVTEALSVDGATGTDEVLHKILKRTAAVVSLNPWDPSDKLGGLLGYLKRKPFGTTCIWFHELSSDGKALRIRDFHPVNPTKEVWDALKEIKDKYSAPIHDENWFQKALTECEKDDLTIDMKKFLAYPERQSRTSLAGYVIDRKTSLGSRSSAALFFNDSYKNCVSDLSDPVRSWIDVQSASATCVIDPFTKDRRALGAIILWKNSVNGITQDDDRCLVIASKLLGAVLANRKVNNAAA